MMQAVKENNVEHFRDERCPDKYYGCLSHVDANKVGKRSLNGILWFPKHFEGNVQHKSPLTQLEAMFSCPVRKGQPPPCQNQAEQHGKHWKEQMVVMFCLLVIYLEDTNIEIFIFSCLSWVCASIIPTLTCLDLFCITNFLILPSYLQRYPK